MQSVLSGLAPFTVPLYMDHPVTYIIGEYGLYAVFVLALLEGDITLLVAGVLAHSGFFGEYSFAKVLLAGTLGGALGDNIAYAGGRGFRNRVRTIRFYRLAQPRIERLTDRFGPLSIFLTKYIYGLRTASCVFYGIGRMRYVRFLPCSILSCSLWVLILSGTGYFFSGTVTRLIGDYHHVGFAILVIVVAGIAGLVLLERYWVSKKVEAATPDRLHEIEHVAQERLQVIKHEIHERLHHRRQPAARPKTESKSTGAKHDLGSQ
jgi:membrane-associated protein